MAKKIKTGVKTTGSSRGFFMLTWKKFIITLIIWLVAVLLHDFTTGMFQYEETIFFIIAIILIPVYLVIAVLYSIAKKRRR